jgi:hypothetical protein
MASPKSSSVLGNFQSVIIPWYLFKENLMHLQDKGVTDEHFFFFFFYVWRNQQLVGHVLALHVAV